FQWQNFLPLIENSLSENNSSLIVGDVKQSIYRWRNGNMKLLLEDAKKDLAGFLPLIKEESLNVNYRSKKRIVDFNNAFFKAACEICAGNSPAGFGDVITKAYADIKQETKNKSDDGYVNIKFYVSDRDSGVTSRELAGENMIYRIKSLLESGYRQRDILVLVRGNQDALEAAQLLIYAGLKVISSDSLLLTNSPKVRLLLNLFKYIVDNSNNIARTEILYNYLIYIKHSDAKLNDIFTDHLKENGSFKTLFKELLPTQFFKNGNGSEINVKLSGLGLYDLAEELIMIFSLGGNADTYLLRFLDVLKKYSDENNSDVYGFVKWWEENKSDNTIVVPEEEDAIRVMTIHKAKGLQAPVVFIPYANWDFGFKPGKSLIWASSDNAPFDKSPAYFVKASTALGNSYFSEDYNEELTLTHLDNLNLMYVAFTRAEDKLFISVPRKGSNTFCAVNVIEESIKNNAEFAQGFDPQNYEYESGLNNKPGQKNGDSKEYTPYIMNGLVSGNIFKKIIVKPEFENFVLESKTDIKQLKNRGIIIHKALSLINNASKEAIIRAIDMIIVLGLITVEQKDKLYEELKIIFSIEKVRSWFSPKFIIMNERDIILPGGNIYRPDKVIIDEDKAIVVDYKTGSRKNEHTDQIKMYGKILEDMGFKVIEMNLFYVNDLKIETVK
ncbi:MAG: UvrD-helicase domain-containing protein, partial [Ignavibacteria bacterium]|nr:UvrD-helicase domain-containing protein [Ignavibacteria bacterium]